MVQASTNAPHGATARPPSPAPEPRWGLGGLAWLTALGIGLSYAARERPALVGGVACAQPIWHAGWPICGDDPPWAERCGAGAGSEPARVGDAVDARCRPIGRMPAPVLGALGLCVDLGRAERAELESLAGIGPALAARIEAGRPYAQTEALLEVSGIGPAKLARIAPRVRVRCPELAASRPITSTAARP